MSDQIHRLAGSQGLARRILNCASQYAVEQLERRVLLSLAAPIGPELLINEATSGPQVAPSVASDAAGNFVATWTAYEGHNEILARLYDAMGQPRGPQFKVNTMTANSQEKPVVAMDADGDFVVAWRGATPGTSYYSIYARRFNPAGVPLGNEFRLQTFTTRGQDDPSVGMDSAGNFVITWQTEQQFGQGPDVAAQCFDATGAPVTNIFKVNTRTYLAAFPWRPRVAMREEGFIVVWQSKTPEIANFDIFARRFDRTGNAYARETLVNAVTSGDQTLPSVSIDATGNYVVAWQGNDANNLGIFARRYSPSGEPLGSDFGVNAHIDGSQRQPATALDDGGDLTIAWHGNGPGDGGGIFLRRFDANGVPAGSDFRVNSFTTDAQSMAAIALDDGNQFIVAWARTSGDYGIGAQRFGLSDTSASVGDFVFNDVNGDGIQNGADSGRSGATVNLFNDAGVFVSSTTTNQQGRYSFSILPDRPHYVQFALPMSTIFSPRDAGGDDGLDSDADRVTGRTSVFTVEAQQTNVGTDAGVVVPASVSGTVFNDLNNDGLRQPDEPGLAGWTIFDDRDGNGTIALDEPFANTGFSGDFVLGRMLPGTTSVAVGEQIHWSVATPRSLTLAVGQNLSGVDFGNHTAVPDFVSGPDGPEFRVNSSTAGDEAGAEIAADAAGNFVVTWGNSDVFAQRYDVGGEPVGLEFRVNTNTNGDQRQPRVAMDEDGDFVITWHAPFVTGSSGGVRAQRYNSSGIPQGGEFKVNTFGENDFVAGSTVAMDSAGNFVIAWRRGEQGVATPSIYAQRYAADGSRVGDEFRANTYTFDDKFGAEIAMDADGDFVIAWTSTLQDGSSFGVYGRRFGSDGHPLGDEFQVNSQTLQPQSDPAIDHDAAGNFIITWKSHAQSGDDEYGVYARRYSSAGESIGGEFRVNTYTTRRQQDADVTMFQDGSWVVVWESFLQDGSEYGVYARHYNAAAVPQGPEVRINTLTSNRQAGPAVAALHSGALVVAWYDERIEGDIDVYAQHLAISHDGALVGDKVFHDINGDGAQSLGEPGIDGVSVSAFNEYGAFAGNTVASGGGLYTVHLLPDRDHYLQFTKPAGMIFTAKDAADDSIDSDVDNTGRTDLFAIAHNQQDFSHDAGLVAPAAVGGLVYSDRNDNGEYDRSDPRLPGWIVYLDGNENGQLDATEPSSTTGATGGYQINDLLPGVHRVSLLAQDLWTSASPVNVTLAPAETRLDVFLGNRTSVPAIALEPAGPEFAVNSAPSGREELPAVAADADGNFVVVWRQFITSSQPQSIRGQRFSGEGVPLGQEFVVFASTVTPPQSPAVAMDPDGDFVVSWYSPYSDGEGDAVFARRFEASGVPLGDVFQVNVFTTANQRFPSVVMDRDGNFLIAFTSIGPGVWARQFAANGSALGQEFRLDQSNQASKTSPSVAMEPDGDFVAAWASYGQDGSRDGVYARQFLANGAPLASEFRVNTFTTLSQTEPSVAVDSHGRFIITWSSAVGGSAVDIYGRRYNAAGIAQGGEFRVNSNSTNDQRFPSVAMDDQGGFLVAWQSDSQPAENQKGVFARRFSPAGEPIGNDIHVNTYTLSDQIAPAVASDGSSFVVVWQSQLQAGSGYDIYAQRYAPVGRRGAPATFGDRAVISSVKQLDDSDDDEVLV